MKTNRNWAVGWIVAFLGFPIGGALATVLVGHLDNPTEGFIGGGVAGAVLGLAQWLALRSTVKVPPTWIVATSVGLALGVSLNTAIFGTETTINAIVTRAPLTGLILGLAQWFLLRNHVKQAFWWIPANVLMYTVSWFVTSQVIGNNVNQGFIVFGASGAILYQGVMGLLLWWLGKSKEAEVSRQE